MGICCGRQGTCRTGGDVKRSVSHHQLNSSTRLAPKQKQDDEGRRLLMPSVRRGMDVPEKKARMIDK
jgi:hypothetical protein